MTIGQRIREARERKDMTLIAGFKSPKDVLFKADFEYWNEKMKVIKTVDTAPEGYEGPVGMVTKYIPDLKFENIENTVSCLPEKVNCFDTKE